MGTPRPRLNVLIAEDDDDDFFLTEKALRDGGFDGNLIRVRDGAELMEFLLDREAAGNPVEGKLLLLLDLNMPRKDGRVALAEIKAHPGLRHIPVVVLTTSSAESDIASAYGLGANSFLRKPACFEEFVALIKTVKQYWFETVAMPARCGALSLP